MLRWQHVPIEKGPQWPLPPDYATLTDEGQRLARVNACLMEDTPQLAAHSWLYFCKHYLLPDREQGFDPMFYAPPVREFGFIHPLMVRAVEGNRRSALALPRGSAKTTTFHSYILKKMVTHAQYRIRLFKASEDQIADEVRIIRDQLEDNARLRSDFGDLVPGRNSGLWSHHDLRTLDTKCTLKVRSVWSRRLRGGRLDLGILDDVEYDPDNPAQSDDDVWRLALRITKIIFPMMEEKSRFVISGTNIHCRSLLNTIVQPDALMPDRDPRFRDALWFKINVPYKVVHKNADGSEREVRAWSKFTDAFMQEQRETLGDAQVGSEFEGNPISSLEAPFEIVPRLHEYTVIDMPEDLYEQPFSLTTARVQYHECSGIDPMTVVERTVPWNSWLEQLYRFITVDYAYTSRGTSDWSVVHVFGSDARNDVWSLDMWRGRVKFPALVGMIWRLALRWKVACLGVEAYPVQEEYYQQVAAFGDRVQQQFGFYPALKPIKPPIDKGARILRLTWRFERGKLKLPAWRRHSQPYFTLYQQIRAFTEDLQNLPTDDELDTLSMTTDMLQGRARGTPAMPSAETPLELLAQGELKDEFGMPILLGLPLQQVPLKLLEAVAARGREERLAEYNIMLNEHERKALPYGGVAIDPYELEAP